MLTIDVSSCVASLSSQFLQYLWNWLIWVAEKDLLLFVYVATRVYITADWQISRHESK